MEWQIITPNDKADWINQRDGVFDNLIPLFDKKGVSVFNHNGPAVATGRDVWVNNFSNSQLDDNINYLINNYNAQCRKFQTIKSQEKALSVESFIDTDTTKVSWTRSLKNFLSRGTLLKFERERLMECSYRPFCVTNLYYSPSLIESPGQCKDLFPLNTDKVILCVNGKGSNKDASTIVTHYIPDYQLQFNCQFYPLYWYEENKNPQATLFDDAETTKYIRRDGITDWILKEVRNRFGGTKAITKEHIFYYVYGLLHSPQYRERFADDLKKSLPRIPIVDNVQDFMAFYKAGKELADLHLNYEQGINIPATEQGAVAYSEMSAQVQRTLGVIVTGDIDIWQDEWTEETYQYFAVEKMRFAKVRDENGKLIADKTRIIYNSHITIEKAYEYIVNGKSAIEWIMERYAVTIDKASQIKNDPNAWSREHEQPRYILDLLLSVIMLSCQTVDIVNSLPILHI